MGKNDYNLYTKERLIKEIHMVEELSTEVINKQRDKIERAIMYIQHFNEKIKSDVYLDTTHKEMMMIPEKLLNILKGSDKND